MKKLNVKSMRRAKRTVELTRKNGVSKVGDAFRCNGVAWSKATGLTYCHVAWKRIGLYKHSRYSKMAERASCLVWKRTRPVHSLVKVAKNGSMAALS
jgi:hypothetical protein